MKIVRIKCLDMVGTSSTWTRKEIAASYNLIDLDIIGWLVEDRKDCIILAAEYQPYEDQFRHVMAIPKVCIKKITIIGGS